jgi:hypothetical protein
MKKLRIFTVVTIIFAMTTHIYGAWWIDKGGFGFSGKDDVRRTLGWNSKQLQSNANSLVFTYHDRVTWAVSCVKDGMNDTINYSVDRTRTVNYWVAYDGRLKTQVTGFYLNGWTGEEQLSGGMTGCPGGWETVGEPYLVADSSGGNLLVNGVPVTSGAN